MLERRLYYHVDWAMLAALLALCAIGLAQIYSATAGRRDFNTQMYASSRLVALVSLTSITDARGQVALHLFRDSCLSSTCSVWVVRGGSRTLDRLGRSTPAVRIRQGGSALVLPSFR